MKVRSSKQQPNARNRFLMEIGQIDFLQKGSLRNSLNFIVEKLAVTLDVSMTNIWLYREGQAYMEVITGYDTNTTEHSGGGTVVQISDAPAFLKNISEKPVIATNELSYENASELDAYYQEHDIHAIIHAPIRREGKVVAILSCENTESRLWSTDDIYVMAITAQHVVNVMMLYDNQSISDELEQTRNILGIAINSAVIGTWIWNVNTGIITFNHRWMTKLGFENELSLSYQHWKDRIHPVDKNQLIKEIDACLEGMDDLLEAEYRFMTGEGYWRWILLRGKVIKRDASNRPSFLSGIQSDITDKKEGQKKIREFTNTYRMLFKEAPDPLWVHDLETRRFLMVNEATTFYYGYTDDEFMKMTLDDLNGKSDMITSKEHDLANNYSGIARHFKKDGSELFMEIKTQLISFDDHKACLVHAKDVTQKLKYQLEIIKNENLFRSLFENSPLSISLYDNNYTILSVNRAFEELFKYTVEDLNSFESERMLIPRGLESEETEIAHKVLQGNFLRMQTKRITRDNELIDVLIFGVPIKVNDEVKFYFKIYFDVTYINKMQHKMNALNNELETLMYKASHNLKGPLATIKGLLNLIKNDREFNLNLYLDYLKSSTDLLEDTLKELLDISYIHTNAPIITSFPMKSVLLALKSDFQEQLRERNVNLQFEGDILSMVMSDRDIVQSSLRHLIDNSIKYSHNTLTPSIIVRVKVTDVQILITVEDNGEGINRDYLERIFNMFYRANEKSVGSGLGLYFVKKSIERIGGNIEVHSEVNDKTIFKIILNNRFWRTRTEKFINQIG